MRPGKYQPDLTQDDKDSWREWSLELPSPHVSRAFPAPGMTQYVPICSHEFISRHNSLDDSEPGDFLGTA